MGGQESREVKTETNLAVMTVTPLVLLVPDPLDSLFLTNKPTFLSEIEIMESIEETLRKSKELSERYQKFVMEREKAKAEEEETQRRLDNTITLLQKTIADVGDVTTRIDRFQRDFSNAIDALAHSASSQTQSGLRGESEYQPAKQGTLKDVLGMVRVANRIMCLTGAGMSAASGLRTFRGTGGYWTNTEEQRDPKKILRLEYFNQNKEQGWRWLIEFYKAKIKAKPNRGHFSLEGIRRYCLGQGKRFDIVTQNIDNLHTQAAQQLDIVERTKKLKIGNSQSKQPLSQNIEKAQSHCFEIHGNITKLRCETCTDKNSKLTVFPCNFSSSTTQPYVPPTCSHCSTQLRPHIMMFDESYSEPVNSSLTLKEVFEQCDLLLVIGTALETGMANYLVNRARSKDIKIVEVNIERNIGTGNTWTVLEKSEDFLAQLEEQLLRT